ncbi:hypothetical protein [Tenacibaculum sp. IB213877]|uniref:hypothetical protein n=1 Tax=Tenacibaculum sp. IB213877 TaxID=3097351 RepID=UPI002A5AF954|nr:hypothetical protein [Tenacibaculum sp. IB213877]MDY0780280.1 hypothetical protein [Tenacibaculum sp. IB213877]
MKKIVTYILFVSVALVSCTSEEQINEQDKTLLKKYEIKKDAQGKYSIDYKVEESSTVEVIKNYENNFNEIHLHDGKVAMKQDYSQGLNIENDQLKIGFFENGSNKRTIIIEDENIVLAKKSEFEGKRSSPYLESYSITDLGNNEYELNFVTTNGVSVVFNYNENTHIYEIHLKPLGTNINSNTYSKSYVKSEDILQIDFINYVNSSSTKNSETYLENDKVPRVIIRD